MNLFAGPLLQVALFFMGVGLIGLALVTLGSFVERILARWDARRSAKRVHKIGTVSWDDAADRMVIEASPAKLDLLAEKMQGREPVFGPVAPAPAAKQDFELFPDYGQTIPEIPRVLPRARPIDLDDTTETAGEVKLNTIDIATVEFDIDKTPVRKYPKGTTR